VGFEVYALRIQVGNLFAECGKGPQIELWPDDFLPKLKEEEKPPPPEEKGYAERLAEATHKSMMAFMPPGVVAQILADEQRAKARAVVYVPDWVGHEPITTPDDHPSPDG
jgi:hypothetical protein